MPIPSYILPSAPVYTEDSVYALIPTPSTPIYTPDAISFTRGSDATRTASNGLIQRVPWNLYQQSNTFNVTWIKAGVTSSITANSGISPDGTNNAWYYSAIGGVKNLRQDISLVANNVYTVSIWVKSYGLGNNTFRLGDGGSASTLTTVTATSDWQRVTCTFTSATTGSRSIGIFQVTSENPIDVLLYGAQLVEGSSAQTYFPTTDRLNVPRIDFSQGSCPALLLEPQRTNLVLNSNDMTLWSNGAGTMTKNVTTSPDGTNNALSFDNTGQCSTFVNAVNGTYSYSLFVKNGTSLAASIDMSDGATGDVLTTFTFSTKTFSGTSAGGSWTSASTSFVELNNGWFRITLTATKNAGSQIGYKINSTGVGGTSTYVYGAQLELGSYATTYIPTTTTSVTRLADSFSKSNIFTNGLITAAGGTWYVELRGNLSLVRDGGVNFGLGIGDSAGTNAINIWNVGVATATRLQIRKNIASGGSATIYTTTADTVKLAIKWNGTSIDVFENGTKVVSASAFTITNMDFLRCSCEDRPRFIQAMALYPTPLSDAALITMTT